MRTFHAWLELGRVSNLPTVWANTLHGFGAAVYLAARGAGMLPPAGLGTYLDQGFMLLVGMSLIYTAGMVLNDVCDAAVDARERPGRPIPSGRVSRRSAGVVGVALLLVGVAATAVYASAAVTLLAILLAACVLAYNLFHHHRAAGAVLMPSCRALVILTAGSVLGFNVMLPGGWLHLALPAATLAVYTAVISAVARSEAKPGQAARQRIVVALIAAMPLLDAAFLAALGLWPLAGFCVACSVATLIAQRWVWGS